MTFNKEDFELIVGGKDKAIQEIKRAEINEEYLAVRYIGVSNIGCCTTEDGRDSSGSFGRMLTSWIKTWSDEEIIKHTWLIRVEDTIKKFEEWIFDKYDSNKKKDIEQKEKWKGYFNNEDVYKDMIIVLKYKIFELKLDPANAGLCEIQDPRVYMAVRRVLDIKEDRRIIHEGLNRINKYATGGDEVKELIGVPKEEEFNDYQKSQIRELLEEVVNELMKKLEVEKIEKTRVPLLENGE